MRLFKRKKQTAKIAEEFRKDRKDNNNNYLTSRTLRLLCALCVLNRFLDILIAIATELMNWALGNTSYNK